MSFIIAAVVMIVVAAACLAVPLWRARSRAHLSSDAANRAIHAARAEELELDMAAGRLAHADYNAARRDLDRELAGTLRNSRQEQERSERTPGKRWTAGIVAALLIVVAAVLYWQLGNWRAGIQGVQQASVASVENMVVQLAQRLHTTDPNDLQGWATLGHAYLLMGRYNDAADAYAQARRLSGDKNAEILANYGEAVALGRPQDFMSEAMPAFEKALQLDPRNPLALWYGGLGALKRGDEALAVSRWQSLLAQAPPAYRSIIEKSIAAAGGVATPATLGGTKIKVRVTLAGQLRDEVSPDEALFVFAVAAGQSDGPLLAARRFEVRDLPLDVTLSNSDAVIPGHNLSNVSRATIVARIASKGGAIPRSGDFVGQARWRAGGRGSVNILIDRVLQ